jgi:multidrug efflux pump
MGSVEVRLNKRKIRSGHRRTVFGYFIKFITGNPIMPIVTLVGVVAFVIATFQYFGANNKGVEFFVETEPEQAIVYVQARGNLSISEKDALLRQAEDIIITTPGVQSTFAFAGNGGLNANTGGAGAPLDTIGQAQIELIPWGERPSVETTSNVFGFIPWTSSEMDKVYSGNQVIKNLQARLDTIPGIQTQILNLAMGPASAKPVHLRLKGDNWDDLLEATALARQTFETTKGLIAIEDTLPLPGIDWQIDVDVEKAGRYGADVATVGGMVQLVTRGLFLDTMRVDSSDEEIEIRVRLPEKDRVLSTLDTLKVRTPNGLIPLSNFISRHPVAKLGQINRVDQQRYFDIKAGVETGLTKTITDADGVASNMPLNPNERISLITEWLETSPLPQGIEWEWTGDQEDQAESGAFLQNAFIGALGLMFIILLAQFNSIYNSVLVLLAVILSTTGVLIGMLVMDQAFSIIMTGTGIVALAGIVVNNNIVLIDTYQEYSAYMPRLEAIIRTAEARIRPVLLTTITTMAGLTPMMFGLSLDFIGGGYTIDAPTALWWKQLATAVVFGLGIATLLTLVFTPSMLALRIWMTAGAYGAFMAVRAGSWTREGRRIRDDFRLGRSAKKHRGQEILWDDEDPLVTPSLARKPIQPAE